MLPAKVGVGVEKPVKPKFVRREKLLIYQHIDSMVLIEVNLTNAFHFDKRKNFVTRVRDNHPEAFNWTNICHGDLSVIDWQGKSVDTSCVVQQGDLIDH